MSATDTPQNQSDESLGNYRSRQRKGSISGNTPSGEVTATGEKPDGQSTPKSDRSLSALDRLVLQAMGQGRSLGLIDDPARTDYPELWRWLSQIYWGEAQDRVVQPATLTVRLGPEGVLVSIYHRDLGASCDAACLHLADILPAIEAALTAHPSPVKVVARKEPTTRRRKRE